MIGKDRCAVAIMAACSFPVLRAEESVAIKEAVNVMDIANRNNYKVILAVRPN